jgi:hypothetical protein
MSGGPHHFARLAIKSDSSAIRVKRERNFKNWQQNGNGLIGP